ncbi:MAG: GGDEF domain-containing protein, partial [Planctomycetota bacterium]|nr:GGDEF domain-containing protein [Planctomycetota bacterium]
HFKKFNDDFGHQAGDEVLRMVGGKLGEIADSVGFAARYGGEEFAVILANEAATVAEKLAELIRAALERTEVRFDGRPLKVTASIGVATERPDQGDVTNEGLISKADARLYAAKRKGRNRVVASDPEPAIARR